MFVQYVKYMYNLLNAIINKEDSVNTKYNTFEVNHINMFLTQKEIVNIEIPITSSFREGLDALEYCKHRNSYYIFKTIYRFLFC